MSVELTQEVSDRLISDHCGWLTTVAKSGQPVPRLVWFYFDGAHLRVHGRLCGRSDVDDGQVAGGAG